MEIKRIRAHMLLKDRRGTTYPLVPVAMLILFMLLTVATEYMRLLIVAQGVRDGLQSSIISTINDNYDDIYHGAREGYAGGYQPSDGGFEVSIDHGDVYGRLDTLLGLSRSGNDHVKRRSDNTMEYSLTGLSVSVQNAPLAPTDPQQAQKFTADATVRLTVPISFGGKALPAMTIDLKVRAGWIELF